MGKTMIKTIRRGYLREVKSAFAFNIDNFTNEEIRQKFVYWSRHFLSSFFDTKDAEFHKEIDLGNIEVYRSGGEFLDIGFRGAAKTNRTKILVAFCIANDFGRHRKYIKILSKEIDNANQIVTDVYNIFTRPNIKKYYPEIFMKTETKREERMSSFTTSTGVKMTGDSVGTDQRGDIQDESRPDLIILEDFETRMSLMSAVTTNKIWENIEEAKNGLAKSGGMIYNCNYVSERGNVHKLVKKVKNQIIIPIEKDGKPTWPERYTVADVNKIRKDADDFEGEYQCKPSASKDVYFDRESIDKQVAIKPIEEIASLKIFKKYDASHRIGSGHDVGKGVGLDSSTSCFIDFTSIPFQVIATYKNNEIDPKTFAYEIKRQAARFGNNYVGAENNYGSTNDFLVEIYDRNKLHKTMKKTKVILQSPTDFGWNTNKETKIKMISEFAKAVEEGGVVLNDPDLIAEARSYTLNDFMDSREVDPRITTRHFDLLTAACIAYQMKYFAPSPSVRNYENKLYGGVIKKPAKGNPAR